MTKTVYALLIGIDAYQPPVPPLRGCVADIERFHTFLEKRIIGEGNSYQPLLLRNSEATRQSVIDGFKHLSRAKSGDVALFYYSGHGGQEKAPKEFLRYEPDGLNETLVCYDSRHNGKWDLADKELAYLIYEVSQQQPHIVIILDCCHSGSGTKAIQPEVGESVRVRRVETDSRLRPLTEYIVKPEQVESARLANAERAAQTNWIELPEGPHLVLSACHASELAKEMSFNGQPQGVFSYYLLEALQRSGPVLSYRDLYKQVNAMVRNKAADQSPQLEGAGGLDINQPFLGGAVQAHDAYYTLGFNEKQNRWEIDGGAVHGIPAVVGDETTHLAIFDLSVEPADMQDLTKSVAHAQVAEVLPGESVVEVIPNEGHELSATTYRAVVTALPLTPLRVSMQGDSAALDLVREQLSQADQATQLVKESDIDDADLVLKAEGEHYQISRTADAYPLVVDTPEFTADSAATVVQNLEHIARWQKVAELDNPTSRLQNAIRLDVCLGDDCDGEEPRWVTLDEAEIRLVYPDPDTQPAFKIRLKNTTDETLYCALLGLGHDYSIETGFLDDAGNVKLGPKKQLWAFNGNDIKMELADKLWQAGVIEVKDTLKVIASTNEFDARLLKQGPLGLSVIARAVPGQMNTLNRLMYRTNMRAFDLPSQSYADWSASSYSFVTVRPRATHDVPPKEAEPIDLGSGVSLHGHEVLKAKARLTSLPQASRDLGNLTAPAWLRADPGLSMPFEFSNSRSGEPGLSVLELSDLEDESYQEVSPESPLILNAATPLSEDEVLLPLGWDGEFFIPLGYGERANGATKITLQRLTPPTADGQRSLGGSIKILFQKVVSKIPFVDKDYDWPRLALPTVTDDGSGAFSIDYNDNKDDIQKAVAEASNITVYIHGIIGETTTMAASGWLATLPEAGREGLTAFAKDNLILTFDYENLNTPIEDTAGMFYEKLVAAGLGPGTGKTVHIVAHSMGGLVARCMIEQMGGKEFVQKLTMLGTPNGGSPWPKIEDWFITLLCLGLNGINTFIWPLGLAGKLATGLLGQVEKADVTLDQMNEKNPFIKDLANNEDPQVPYVVLAGNTSIIETALETEPGADKSRLDRLLARLEKQNLIRDVGNLVFLKEPNDVAVSVESIFNVPKERNPEPVFREVPTDHFGYFNTTAGLRALGEFEDPMLVNNKSNQWLNDVIGGQIVAKQETTDEQKTSTGKDKSESELKYAYCATPQMPEPELSPDIDPMRARVILDYRSKWANGTVLHYYFFDQSTDGEYIFFKDGTREWYPWTTTEEEKDVVRHAFQIWKEVGIGLEFEEVGSRHEAEIRIGFMRGNGAWSYVGRQILGIGPGQRTMNFGWDLTENGTDMDTALHEIGHTLGFHHEHQNPNAGIEWDEAAVYADLAGPPNRWGPQTTYDNILRKISPGDVQGSSWDPDSIMHYPFKAGLILRPEAYKGGVNPVPGLSERDKAWVRRWYPPLTDDDYTPLVPFRSADLAILEGDQRNFIIEPEETRTYNLQTFGVSDAVIVLFEDDNGQLRYLKGNDDSGEDHNANLQVKLFKGRRYILRVRLYYSASREGNAIMLW